MPTYECCTFRGSLVALHAATGRLVWKTHTIEGEARAIGKNRSVVSDGGRRAPRSGARRPSIPSAASVYVATGNMYTEPQQPTSDAIMAFTLDAGKIAWTNQVTPQDVFVVGCGGRGGANCPPNENLGPDFDFGNSPMLVDAARRPRSASSSARNPASAGRSTPTSRARSSGSTAPGGAARSAAWSGDRRQTPNACTSPSPT